LANDALAIVSEYGPCTEFVTLTCNANWREIKERLLEGQDAFDRPDICAQVFREKLKLFIENLKAGKYHGGKTRYVNDEVDGTYIPHEPENGSKVVVYIMCVIEYQHRGLPHAHIVYKISYAPEGPRRDDTPEVAVQKIKEVIKWIDGHVVEFEDEHGNKVRDEYHPHIVAYRPGKPNMSDLPRKRSSSEEGQIVYDDLIGENQLHKCAVAENGCKQTPESKCKVSLKLTSFILIDVYSP